MTTATTMNIDAASMPGAASSARLANRYSIAIIATWGAAAAILAERGVFNAPPGTPPLAALVAAVAPPAIFYTAHRFSPTLRGWVRGLDIVEVIAAQSWRIIGFAFLAAWGLGAFPAVFAAPAGFGDVAVGLAAPAVALAAARNSNGWRTSAYSLTGAGIVDFIVAFATGILAAEGAPLHFAGAPASSELGVLPFSLFPTFIVPAFLILHVIALIKLSRN